MRRDGRSIALERTGGSFLVGEQEPNGNRPGGQLGTVGLVWRLLVIFASRVHLVHTRGDPRKTVVAVVKA